MNTVVSFQFIKVSPHRKTRILPKSPTKAPNMSTCISRLHSNAASLGLVKGSLDEADWWRVDLYDCERWHESIFEVQWKGHGTTTLHV